MALILFDIDGTLLRRAGDHHRRALISGVASVTGLATTFDGVDTSGMLDRDLIHLISTAAGASGRRIRANMRQIVNACEGAYLSDCAMDLRDRVCPGVRPFLAACKERGAALGLVTGNLTRIGWKKMELAGLCEFFSVGAFAEDGRTRARLAQVARWRAIRNGLASRRDRVALVGDHANDIRAAKANGFLAVAVGTGVMPMDRLAAEQPDVLVNDLLELDPGRLL